MTTRRTEPPLTGDERRLLTAFLDYQRDTLALKCDGLTDAQLRERAVPPSSLSLLGLVRHLAHVERAWFRRVIAGEDVGPMPYKVDNPDGDFDGVDGADVAADFARWRAECDDARRITAQRGLDATGTHYRDGTEHSLRWVLVHMIEEYARHNGHADLLRERIDGAVGE